MVKTRQDVETAAYQKAGARYTDDGELVATQLGLFDLYLDDDDESCTPCLARDGYWESWITAWTINNVTEGMTCLDIGANQGYFTFLLANLVGRDGVVVAYEPMPRNYHLLIKSRALNDLHNVSIFPFAVSEDFGKVELVVPGLLRGSASIAVDNFGGQYGDEERITVKTVPLDYYAPAVVDFIKIDAEGAEPGIWRGMQEVIKRNPQVLITMEFDHRRNYPDDFIREMFETMHVSVIDDQGNEYPIWEEELRTLPDWVMLALRRNNS